MLKFITNYIEKIRRDRTSKKAQEIQNREQYVYRCLLRIYEAKVKGTVDFGAWWYASRQMELIIAANEIDKAYIYYKDLDERGQIPCDK